MFIFGLVREKTAFDGIHTQHVYERFPLCLNRGDPLHQSIKFPGADFMVIKPCRASACLGAPAGEVGAWAPRYFPGQPQRQLAANPTLILYCRYYSRKRNHKTCWQIRNHKNPSKKGGQQGRPDVTSALIRLKARFEELLLARHPAAGNKKRGVLHSWLRSSCLAGLCVALVANFVSHIRGLYTATPVWNA